MPDLATFQQWVQQQLTQNDVFAGLVGGSMIGSVLYVLRSLPGQLWRLLVSQLTVSLIVANDSEAYPWLDEWLSRHEYSRRSRRLRLDSHWRDAGGEGHHSWILSAGYGHHYLRIGHRPALVERKLDESNGQGRSARRETLEIQILGRSQAPIRSLIEEARSLSGSNGEQAVLVWDGCWTTALRKVPRALETVVLPEGQLERIVADLRHFIDSPRWYSDRGVPYRRGYLFAGPPGTGKTSLVTALAGYFERPICILNLASLKGDSELQSAFWSARRDAILLIEDIDAARISQDRSQGSSKTSQSEPEGCTLSALLNIIDGVAATEGRILVMTTNHPERLDPALVRPGRVDVREDLGPVGPLETGRLFTRFFPEAKAPALPADLRLVPASIQGDLLRHRDDPEAAAEALRRRVQG